MIIYVLKVDGVKITSSHDYSMLQNEAKKYTGKVEIVPADSGAELEGMTSGFMPRNYVEDTKDEEFDFNSIEEIDV